MKKKLTLKIIPILILSFVLGSCRKDNVIVENDLATNNALGSVEIKDNRLTFSDGKAFGNFMMSVNIKEESPKVFAALKQKGFTSAQTAKVSKATLNNNSNSSAVILNKRVIQANSAQTLVSTQQATPEKDLVSDPLIEEMLNDDMEVEIQGIIYKVTPYGTFVVTRDHYSQLTQILEQQQPSGGDLKESTFYSESTGNNLYKVADEIYLYDTFSVKNPEAQMLMQLPVDDGGDSGGGGGGGYSPPAPNYNPQIENHDYSSLPSIDFGAKTIVGKFLAGVFGTNEVYKGEFSDDRRVKVSLSNTNYVFVKSFGVKVEFQKKNWIGWSGTSCEQLRLGWEGVEFKTKSNIPVEPQLALGTPVNFSGNPNWDTTLPPWAKPTSQYLEFDLLGYNAKINKTTNFQKAAKELYDHAQQWLGRKPTLNDKSKVIAWKDEARTQVTFIGGPEEEVKYNAEEIEKNFARSIDAIISVPMSTSYSAILKAVLATFNASQKETQIELIGASVYGVAKCDGKWLGARIDKNDE